MVQKREGSHSRHSPTPKLQTLPLLSKAIQRLNPDLIVHVVEVSVGLGVGRGVGNGEVGNGELGDAVGRLEGGKVPSHSPITIHP